MEYSWCCEIYVIFHALSSNFVDFLSENQYKRNVFVIILSTKYGRQISTFANLLMTTWYRATRNYPIKPIVQIYLDERWQKQTTSGVSASTFAEFYRLIISEEFCQIDLSSGFTVDRLEPYLELGYIVLCTIGQRGSLT